MALAGDDSLERGLMTQQPSPVSLPNLSPAPLTCRFQTRPPIPDLKAAISLCRDWRIEDLILKIHRVIVDESSGDQEFLDLVDGPNPSHRIVLEQADGFRLPISEFCAIVETEQLLTVRLTRKPQVRVGGPLENIQHLQLNSQANRPLILPRIHASNGFPSGHEIPSSYFVNDSASRAIADRLFPRIQSSNSNFFSRGPTNHDPSLSTPLSQRASQPFQTSGLIAYRGGNLCLDDQMSPSSSQLPASCVGGQNEVPADQLESTHPAEFPEPCQFDITEERFSSLLPENNRFTAHHQSRHSESFQLVDGPPVLSQEVDLVDPRLQSADRTQDRSFSQNIGESIDHAPAEQPFDLRLGSSPSEDKPNQEELNGSTGMNNGLQDYRSGSEIPRVRSHIAGLRQSALRHYYPSDSSWSSCGNSSDESDEFASFSRVALNLREEASRRRSHRNPQKQNKKRAHPVFARASKRLRTLAPTHHNSPTDSNSDSEAGLIQDDDDDDDEDDDDRGQSAREGTRTNKSSQTRDQRPRSASHRKPSFFQHVRVVIPPASSFLFRKLLKRKHTRPDKPQETDPAGLDPSRPLSAPSPQAKELNDGEACQEKEAESPSHSVRQEPVALSSGRATRSVYEIYVHDRLFKAASAQGPQRIPYSSSSSGLNEKATLSQVIERLKLDMNAHWQLVIGDKVWLSAACQLKRPQLARAKRFVNNRLDGKLLQSDFNLSLKDLGVLPSPHRPGLKSHQIHVMRNWEIK